MTTTRANFWSVTINNPSEADYECINLARQKGWEVHGQLEMGKEGTRHYQMMVKTPQVRFSAVKKAFPRAHIEVARNVTALKQYVNKEETRVGELPTQQEKYPSVSKMWELILDYLTQDKDGVNIDRLLEGHVEMYWEERETLLQTSPLVVFDEAIRHLIKSGFHVEHHACNPQVRQQWKLFNRELLLRTFDEQRARDASETDRQTDSVQNINIPVVGENTTTQDADDTPRSQASEGVLGQVNDDTEVSCSASGPSDEEGSDEDC